MNKIIAGLGLMMLSACASTPASQIDVDKTLHYCDVQIHKTLSSLHQADSMDYTMMPRNILQGETKWNLRKATKEEWTAGFWPGVLWYDYEATGNDSIKEESRQVYTFARLPCRNTAYDHDLGFLVFCSYGNGYRLTGNEEYKKVILAVSDTLATLYKPAVGAILSWPRNVEMFGGHNTIMDNMINLEMLFWAAKKRRQQESVRHSSGTRRQDYGESVPRRLYLISRGCLRYYHR